MTTRPPGSDAARDVTAANRATYDRIAPLYASRQRRDHRASPSLFDRLETTFLDALPPGGLVGDLGCGPCLDGARFAAAGFTVVGADLSAGMLDQAPAAVSSRLVQADLRALPLRDGTFDGVWNVASLLHVPASDTGVVLAQFRRILRAGGTLALVTAIGTSEEYEPVPYAPREGRYFIYRDEDALTAAVIAAGFRVTFRERVTGNREWLTLCATAVG